MLPDNSFLRRLPANLAPVNRIRLEALVFSSDALIHAYLSLCELAARVSDTDHSFTPRDRMALFSYAWMIVDQLHVLRQLIRAIVNDPPGPNQAKFLELSESAHLMRNRMDHLAGLVKTSRRKKDHGRPFLARSRIFWLSRNTYKQALIWPQGAASLRSRLEAYRERQPAFSWATRCLGPSGRRSASSS
jgi:hypothetical protein